MEEQRKKAERESPSSLRRKFNFASISVPACDQNSYTHRGMEVDVPLEDRTLPRPHLKALDLKALIRVEDGSEVGEAQQQKQKFRFFEKQCSKVEQGLFMSGVGPADRAGYNCLTVHEWNET
jgi:hypothetical protein